MALPWGEYTFTCTECKGDGNLQYIRADADPDEDEESGLIWDKCEECHGEGTVTVDEDEAAEWIEGGHTPLRAPAGYYK